MPIPKGSYRVAVSPQTDSASSQDRVMAEPQAASLTPFAEALESDDTETERADALSPIGWSDLESFLDDHEQRYGGIFSRLARD